jgi:opacity protein-like surface antigen
MMRSLAQTALAGGLVLVPGALATPVLAAETTPAADSAFSGLYLGTFGAYRAVANTVDYTYTGEATYTSGYSPVSDTLSGTGHVSNALSDIGLGFELGLNAVGDTGLFLGADLRAAVSPMGGDTAAEGITGTFNCTSCAYTSVTNWTATTALADARVRFGVTADDWLIYVAAGLGLAEVRSEDTLRATLEDETPGLTIIDHSLLTGWSVGAGFERMIDDHLALTFGYRYADYGTLATTPAVALIDSMQSGSATMERHLVDQTITVGWAYHFH